MSTKGGFAGFITKWMKPPLCVFKLNSDASVKGNRFIEIGFVIQDHRGKVVGAELDRVVGNVDIDCAEAITLRKAMEFAHSFGCSRIMGEVGSSNVSMRLLNPKLDLSYLDLLLEECQNLKENFDELLFLNKRTL